MIKGDYDRLVDLAGYNVCAEHKRQLDVAWSSKEKCYYLRCGVCETPEAITRMLSNTEEWRAGAQTPEEFRAEQFNKGGNETMTQDKPVIPFELGGAPKADLATGERLTEETLMALVNYAYKYKLDPNRGHVCLMYGKPYFTIDGYLYHAKQTGRPYSLISRPMTTVEVQQNKIGETDHAWMAEVVFNDTGSTFTGIGIVTYDEMTAKSKNNPNQLRSPVVAAHPWQLGQKRAEWQALRRAFPIGESE